MHVVACPLCATTVALVDDVAQFIDSLDVPVSCRDLSWTADLGPCAQAQGPG